MTEHSIGSAASRSFQPESTPRLAAAADPSHDENRNGSVPLQISNAMVRLYKDAFGRGPTKARAQFAGPDTLVVLLEDSMTVAERNLAAMGEHRRLRDARLFFQYALEDEFRGVVERILGRRTVAFISGIDTENDVSVELFTLAPREPGGSEQSGMVRSEPSGFGPSDPGY